MEMNTLATDERIICDRLVYSLQGIVENAEQLLKSTLRNDKVELNTVRDKLGSQLEQAKAELDKFNKGTTCPSIGTFPSMRNCPPMLAARAAVNAVHDHPYAAIGISVGVVVLIHMLAPRR